jgi:Holliday junction resolvasome RuvABC endonuclease subunit
VKQHEMKILALDMSSTAIGVCYDGRQFETIRLRGDDIAARCLQARRLVHGHIVAWREDVDLIVIESPASHFNGGLIPQARVSGAVLGLISELGIAWLERTPSAAKKALTGKGNAKKGEMIAAAQMALGGWELDEHQADAYGLWLAAQAVRVEVTR